MDGLRSVIRVLKKALSARYCLVSIVVLLSLLVAGSALLLGYSIRGFIDGALSSKKIIPGVIKMLMAITLFSLSSLLRSWFVNLYADKCAMQMSGALYDSVLQRSPVFFQNFSHSYIISCITNDIAFIRNYIASTASYSIRNIAMFLGALCLMFYISTRITLVLMLIIPVLLTVFSISLRNVRRFMKEQRHTKDAVNGKLSAYLSVLPLAQTFGVIDDAVQTRKQLHETFWQQGIRLYGAKSLSSAGTIFGVLCVVVAMIVTGMISVMHGTLTAGSFAVFVLYSVIATVSLLGLSDLYNDTLQLRNSRARLRDLTNSDVGIIECGDALPEAFDIRFDKVCFTYPGKAELQILKDFSCHITHGRKVAIKGPSGIGKSTVVNLLLRFYDAQSGTITVGDLPIEQIELSAWRKKLSVVFQEDHILPGDLWYNITCTDQKTDIANELLALLSLEHLFKPSTDASVQSRVEELSVGEKQRIAIARCLSRQEAEIFIFDEALAALDKANRDKAMQAIMRYTKGKTVIFITHHYEEYGKHFDDVIELF